MEVMGMPFHAIYTQYIRKKTIHVLLGSILIILLYQTPSKIKYIQNDLKEIAIDNDGMKEEGRENKTSKYIKQQTKFV